MISLRTKERICVQTTLYIQIIQSIIQCFLRQSIDCFTVLPDYELTAYPSRGPVFTAGFVFLVGSVLPFARTCVHSGFCFLGGGLSYPLRGPVFTPGFVFLVGSVLLMAIVFCVVLFAMFDFVLYFMSNLVCILD